MSPKKMNPPGTLLVCSITGTVLATGLGADSGKIFPDFSSPWTSTPMAFQDQNRKMDQVIFPLQGEPGTNLMALKDKLLVLRGVNLEIHELSGAVTAVHSLNGVAGTLALLNEETLLLGYDHQVSTFNLNTGLETLWADLGPGSYITALLVHRQNIYIADSSQKVVYRYSPQGRLKNIITGGEPGHFNVPSPFFDLAPGPQDTLWITNPGRHRVEQFSPEGKMLNHWGESSDQDQGFAGCCNPIGILALEDGRILTREKGIQSIKLYTPTGIFQKVLKDNASFFSSPIRSSLSMMDNKIYYLDRHTIKEINLKGENS